MQIHVAHTICLYLNICAQKHSHASQDASQTLRSALQEKAKKADPKGGSGRKGKRMMRPGQAKTLSDLPQLSA